MLGKGDVNVDGLVATLAEIGYQGWLIVEQDILPQTSARFEQAIQDQRANRAYLAERGL